MKTFCGTTKLRTKKLPILWTGQNAEHIHHNYIKDPNHRPLHVETQKALQTAANMLIRANTYVGVKEESNHSVVITWYKNGSFAEVKTVMKVRSTGTRILKGKSVGAAANKKFRVNIIEADLQPVERELIEENKIPAKKYLSIMNDFYNRKSRKKTV